MCCSWTPAYMKYLFAISDVCVEESETSADRPWTSSACSGVSTSPLLELRSSCISITHHPQPQLHVKCDIPDCCSQSHLSPILLNAVGVSEWHEWHTSVSSIFMILLLYILNRPSLLSNGYQGSFRGGKAAGSVKLTTHFHLVPRSKNEWSYTSTHPIHFHGVVLS
jgi:hypothetical protein